MDNGSMINLTSYTSSHLMFVSNHSGTTVTELFLIIIIPHSIFLFQVFWTLWPISLLLHSTFGFIVQIVWIVIPQLLLTTILDSYAVPVGLVMTLLCSAISVTSLMKLNHLSRTSIQKIEDHLNIASESVSVFRASIFIITSICILAVDFPVFPRRFAKTETYGYGLMDLGVGLFVVANAVTSREARQIKFMSRYDNLQNALKSSVPLLLLGLIRIIAIKVTGYHESVSEYGLHWNFFFTLAFTKIFAGLLFIIIGAKYSLWIGLTIISTYQYLLSSEQLSQYLLKDPMLQVRHDGLQYYLDMNRSGIFSCFGYLSIYLIGVPLGRLLFRRQREIIRGWIMTASQLYIITALLTIVLLISNNLVESVSRRLANFTYVIWVMSFSCYFLGNAVFTNLSVNILKAFFRYPAVNLPREFKERKVPQQPQNKFNVTGMCISNSLLLDAINYNGLVYFLLANVTTGIINLSFHTIQASATTSVVILVLYIIFISYVVFFIKVRKSFHS